MEQQPKRLSIDLLYLGGATIVALVVGTLLMRGSTPPPMAQTSPTPSAQVSPAPSVTAIPQHEPDNCPACGMAVRSERDQDFIQRTQQQQKPKPPKKS